jgi:hypothetical protein
MAGNSGEPSSLTREQLKQAYELDRKLAAADGLTQAYYRAQEINVWLPNPGNKDDRTYGDLGALTPEEFGRIRRAVTDVLADRMKSAVDALRALGVEPGEPAPPS